MSREPPRARKRLLALALGTFAALAALELTLRLVGGEPRFAPYPPHQVFRHGPFDPGQTPGVEGYAYYTTNSFGCRGPEPRGERHRMLVVGGSTANCIALDDDEAWPQLVMDEVNRHFGDERFLWVTNSGKEGRNSRHHLAHARYLVPQIPKLDHVLVYCGLNDVTMWLFERTFDPRCLDDPEKWRDVVAQSFSVSAFHGSSSAWYERLEVWELARRLGRALRTAWHRLGGTDEDADEVIDSDYEGWLHARRKHRRAVGTQRVGDAKMSTFGIAADAYAANLARIAELVRGAGAEPIFVAQYVALRGLTPAEKDHVWMGRIDGGEAYVDPDQLDAFVTAYNERMRRVAADCGALFIDLPALLDGETALCHDGVHFNERGARVAAAAIARVLVEKVYGSSR